MNISVAVDLTGWLRGFQTEIDACLADLAQVCSAVERQTYVDNIGLYQFGVTRLVLANAPQLGQNGPERASRACFLAAIGKFISFLDKLIASQQLTTAGIAITRDIAGAAEITAYLNAYLDSQIASVVGDRSLSNPKKVDAFPLIDVNVRRVALGYFQLRRTLEHHQDIPEKDLVVEVRRPALYVDHIEVRTLPYAISEGQRVELKIIAESRTYPAGAKLVLSPQDAHDLVFTMRNVLAPQFFAHISKSGAGE